MELGCAEMSTYPFLVALQMATGTEKPQPESAQMQAGASDTEGGGRGWVLFFPPFLFFRLLMLVSGGAACQESVSG